MIKKYKEFIKESREDIDSICKKYGIKNYTINEDGSISVDGTVNLAKDRISYIDSFKTNVSKIITLEVIPLKFKRVYGDFYCHENKLTSLNNCPEIVDGAFFCQNNLLETLKGCPKIVNSHFNCSSNNLNNFDGSPERIGGSFFCSNNNLVSFKGCPKYISQNILCQYNNIKDFYGFPDFYEFSVFLGGNPVYEIYKLFGSNNRCTELLNTTRTIVNGDSIRIEGMLDVADAMNIELPEDWKEQIKSYKLIQ